MLAHVLTILIWITSPHHTPHVGTTLRYSYETRFTCTEASDQLNKEALTKLYRDTHGGVKVTAVLASCEEAPNRI